MFWNTEWWIFETEVGHHWVESSLEFKPSVLLVQIEKNTDPNTGKSLVLKAVTIQNSVTYIFQVE